MILDNNLNWNKNSAFPNSDWTNSAKYIVDDNSKLANKIISECPYGFTPVEDCEGNLIDVTPNAQPIEELKKRKIQLSKTLLKDFLKNNPLKSDCHNGVIGLYSVTEEKQQLLANNFLAHTLALQAGKPDVMTWNETEKPCETWEDEECVNLILQMKAFVKPIIAKQQHLEVEINACETVEELERIEVNYDEFKIT